MRYVRDDCFAGEVLRDRRRRDRCGRGRVVPGTRRGASPPLAGPSAMPKRAFRGRRGRAAEACSPRQPVPTTSRSGVIAEGRPRSASPRSPSALYSLPTRLIGRQDPARPGRSASSCASTIRRPAAQDRIARQRPRASGVRPIPDDFPAEKTRATRMRDIAFLERRGRPGTGPSIGLLCAAGPARCRRCPGPACAGSTPCSGW